MEAELSTTHNTSMRGTEVCSKTSTCVPGGVRTLKRVLSQPAISIVTSGTVTKAR